MGEERAGRRKEAGAGLGLTVGLLMVDLRKETVGFETDLKRNAILEKTKQRVQR